MSERTLLLIGAGHTHLHVARHADTLVKQGIRTVFVDPGSFWYSGMAAGLLGGTYAPEEARVDVEPLVSSRGGIWIRDRLTAIDPGSRTVHLAGGTSLSYDALSLNVGSGVPIPFPVSGTRLIPVKPISGLNTVHSRIRDLRTGQKTPRVLVIGGGATGCELAACLAGFAAAENQPLQVDLITRGTTLLDGCSPRAAACMKQALLRAGIRIHPGHGVSSIQDRSVRLEDGSTLEADLILAATGLHPPAWLDTLPLSLGPDGGILIHDTLQSVTDDRIFAVGDCADLNGHPLPRLGVYGVREGPILLHNLQARLSGAPLQRYRPQKRALQILHTGNRRALFVYDPILFEGRLAFRIKDWIDRKFLNQYRVSEKPIPV